MKQAISKMRYQKNPEYFEEAKLPEKRDVSKKTALMEKIDSLSKALPNMEKCWRQKIIAELKGVPKEAEINSM